MQMKILLYYYILLHIHEIVRDGSRVVTTSKHISLFSGTKITATFHKILYLIGFEVSYETPTHQKIRSSLFCSQISEKMLLSILLLCKQTKKISREKKKVEKIDFE